MSRYDYSFDPEATNNTAASIFNMARHGGTRVLDIGSGPGIVSGALTHLADKTATCVDLEEDHLQAATERGVARTVRADLTDRSWYQELAGSEFDVIILADVLEHLVEPRQLVADIRSRGLLAPGGFLVISIPNASHISMTGVLAAGDFPYRSAGLLDSTHLRFFTLKSMRRLLESEGFHIDRIVRTTRLLSQTELHDVTCHLDPELVRLLERQHEESDTYQYVFRVVPATDGRPSVAEADLEQLRRQARQATNNKDRTRNESKAVVAQLEEAQNALAKITARLESAEREVAAVRRSRTWRVGRAIVGGPAAVKRRLARS